MRVERKLPFPDASSRWSCTARAREQAGADSDWDIAVFVRGTPTTGDRSTLSGIGFDLMLETGAFIQSMPVPADMEDSGWTWYRNVRRDGIAL